MSQGKQTKDATTSTGDCNLSTQTRMTSCVLTREQARDCLTKAKVGGLVLGSIIGCFLESAMLGVCWVVNYMYEGNGEETLTKNNHAVIIGVALWCVATGAAAATICFMLRNLVWAVFVSTYDYEKADRHNRLVTENLMERIVKNVDSWFGAGCVLGMCTFWAFTYIILGMQDHIWQSFWVGLVSAGAWFIMSCGVNTHDSLDDILTEGPTTTTEGPPTTVIVPKQHYELKRKAVDPPACDMAVPLLP